ncbi:hypothetical protein FWH13_02520 [Candidatus Saccharibacteria bacterium]|nr:hypothetical protein [Candidatus Saccharibacteria bacterium]
MKAKATKNLNLHIHPKNLIAGLVVLAYAHVLLRPDFYPSTHTTALALTGLALVGLPFVIERLLHIHIPTALFVAFLLFVLGGIYIGHFRAFYINVSHWDNFLHFMSGVFAALIGFSVIKLLRRAKSIHRSEAGFYAFASLTLGLASAAVWEIFEFLLDLTIGSNSQRHHIAGAAEALCGQAALHDTMTDIITAAIGALIMSLIGYYAIKHSRNWLNRFLITPAK